VFDSKQSSPFLAELYHRYLEDGDTAGFVARTAERYFQGTLCRLLAHADRRVRRAAALALGFLGDYGANQALGEALRDEDRPVRLLAEEAIRNVWLRPGDPEQSQCLRILVRLNCARLYQEAVKRATEWSRQYRHLPELFNQRAAAYYALNAYAQSVSDCQKTLALNPYHFTAAAGMGYAQLRMREFRAALESFRRALRINPNLDGVRVQINRLNRLLEGR